MDYVLNRMDSEGFSFSSIQLDNSYSDNFTLTGPVDCEYSTT